MDTLGVLDLERGHRLDDGRAVRLGAARRRSICPGGMAMYARFSSDPFFLLSIGGYHPSFQPPGGLPGAVSTSTACAPRSTISDDVALLARGLLRGHVEHPAVRRGCEPGGQRRSSSASPTRCAARSASTCCSCSRRSRSSSTSRRRSRSPRAPATTSCSPSPCPPTSRGRSRGTRPARRSSSFLGLDVRFDIDVGGRSPAEAPPVRTCSSLVAAALADPSAWRAIAPGDARPCWRRRGRASEDEVWARPDAELEACRTSRRWTASSITYGAYEIAGPSTLTLSGAGIDGAGGPRLGRAASDYFAPAQYDDLSRAEKLAAPSYEAMTAGVRFGGSAVALPRRGRGTHGHARLRVCGDRRGRPDAACRTALLGGDDGTATFAHAR